MIVPSIAMPPRAPPEPGACPVCQDRLWVVDSKWSDPRKTGTKRYVLCDCVKKKEPSPKASPVYFNGVRSGKNRSHRAHLLQEWLGVAPEQRPHERD